MESYQTYCESTSTRTTTPSPNPKARGRHHVAEPNRLPFDAARLPVLSRKRLGHPPVLPLTPPSSVASRRSVTPSPIPVSRFYSKLAPVRTQTQFQPLTPSTPSCPSSGRSRVTDETLLLTPITPPYLRQSATQATKADVFSPTPFSRDRDGKSGTDSSVWFDLTAKPPARSNRDQLVHNETSHKPKAIVFQHFSSDGGPVAALERFQLVRRLDPDLSGMSLFLFCPKRRVPFMSEEQLAKQRRVAEAWRRQAAGQPHFRGIVHAVHTTNIGSKDSGTRLRSFLSLMVEMRYAQMLGIETLVFHPGSTGVEGVDGVDLDMLAEDLLLLLDQVPYVTLAIENSTHRCRGQLGRSIPELAYLTRRVGPRLKVCLDLCHLHVDQYDLAALAGREKMFADLELLGWDTVAAVHVSDSLEVHGGKRDLHAGGKIGLAGMRAILRHPKLLGRVPYILETPATSDPATRRQHPAVQRLEDQRTQIEHSILRELIDMTDQQWADDAYRTRWWDEQRTRRRQVERQIGKLVTKLRGGDEGAWTGVVEKSKQTGQQKLRRKLSFAVKRLGGK